MRAKRMEGRGPASIMCYMGSEEVLMIFPLWSLHSKTKPESLDPKRPEPY